MKIYDIINREAEREEKDKEFRAKYRTVFGNSIGQDVLADILLMTHFGCFLTTETERLEYNIGMALLSRMGILSPENRENVIRALMSVTPKEKKEVVK